MSDFYKTMMGGKFYAADVPRIASALERIATELRRANDLAEAKAGKRESPPPATDRE